MDYLSYFYSAYFLAKKNGKIETVTVQHHTYSVDCALSNTVLAQWNMCCHQW